MLCLIRLRNINGLHIYNSGNTDLDLDKIKEIKYCYWIINKETDQVIGPLRKDDFNRKCQELHIEIKMHRFHEKKFWENRSMKELGIDSADVVRKEADKDTVTR